MLSVVFLFACGGATELPQPNPPPVWPMTNQLVRPSSKPVVAPTPAAAPTDGAPVEGEPEDGTPANEAPDPAAQPDGDAPAGTPAPAPAPPAAEGEPSE